MSGGTLTLDQIWSATSHFSITWSEGIESNKARRILHYLVCRLYDVSQGNLINASLTLAQTTLSAKLGISRQWIGELVQRLGREGWIEHYAPTLPDGTNGSTLFRAGRMLKRVVVMLQKSPRGKNSIKKPAKSRWHFSPSKKEKHLSFLQQKEEKPLTPETLHRIPLLKTWIERGRPKNQPT